MNKDIKSLSKYIEASVSPYHTVAAAAKRLEEAGFTELPRKGAWKLKEGAGYYVIPFKTSLFAFTVTKKPGNIHIAAAHTDNPCLHVKPRAERISAGYMRVNAEVYGGPILNTWLDRPLSMAGRVTLRSDDIYHPEERLIDFKKPVLTIPNLAIHYNREVNKGVELTKQNDMLPVLGMINSKLNEKEYFLDFLAKEMKVKKENILDFDLYVYNTEAPCCVGMNGEMFSAPRLDNLTSCEACIEGIIAGLKVNQHRNCINLIGLYDNEEIGSGTKQGADSTLLSGILEKIYASLGLSKQELTDALTDSFLLSADVAHAIHPAKSEKYDPSNAMLMNEGVTFKLSANQRYSYDNVSVSILQQLAEKTEVPYKKFVNHSDMPGGGTLGPMISSWLPMNCVDIGVPILAMHSARELMGCDDQTALNKLVAAFFTI